MNATRKRRLRVSPASASIAVAIAAAACMTVSVVLANDTVPNAPAAMIRTASPALKPVRPYWIELTVPQRAALAPLADDWERLDLQTKKKWVEISNRYPKMNADEQSRTQQRMREWALLTPDQRRVARDSFARVQAMNPEQRAEMLRKYQELPPEKRQALKSEGHATKALVVTRPLPMPVAKRVEMKEGAKARNPAVAAQKGSNPLVPPARVEPRPVPPAAVPTVAPVSILPVSP